MVQENSVMTDNEALEFSRCFFSGWSKTNSPGQMTNKELDRLSQTYAERSVKLRRYLNYRLTKVEEPDAWIPKPTVPGYYWMKPHPHIRLEPGRLVRTYLEDSRWSYSRVNGPDRNNIFPIVSDEYLFAGPLPIEDGSLVGTETREDFNAPGT